MLGRTSRHASRSGTVIHEENEQEYDHVPGAPACGRDGVVAANFGSASSGASRRPSRRRPARDEDGGVRRSGGSRFRNGTLHDTAYQATLLFRDRMRAQGPSRVGESVRGESTEHALEGPASGGSSRVCNPLHRTSRPGTPRRDDGPGRPHLRGREPTRRGTRRVPRLHLPAFDLRSNRASRMGAGTDENHGREHVGGRIKKRASGGRTSVTPRTTYPRFARLILATAPRAPVRTCSAGPRPLPNNDTGRRPAAKCDRRCRPRRQRPLP